MYNDVQGVRMQLKQLANASLFPRRVSKLREHTVKRRSEGLGKGSKWNGHSEDSLARRTSPREKDYAERPQTTINLKCGDVPRSINLHVPVAMLAQNLPLACPGCTIRISRSYASRVYLDTRIEFIRLIPLLRRTVTTKYRPIHVGISSQQKNDA